jgi:hypothetical protein
MRLATRCRWQRRTTPQARNTCTVKGCREVGASAAPACDKSPPYASSNASDPKRRMLSDGGSAGVGNPESHECEPPCRVFRKVARENPPEQIRPMVLISSATIFECATRRSGLWDPRYRGMARLRPSARGHAFVLARAGDPDLLSDIIRKL